MRCGAAVIRKCRTPEYGRWTFLEFFHGHLHRFLQLGVTAFAHERGILLHLNIGRHTDILHLPLAGERVVDSGTGRTHEASVHEWWTSGHADQAAPGAGSDELADAGAFEVPGHGIAARAGALIDDHHLGSEDALGLHEVASHAIGRGAEYFAIEDLGDVGGEQA